MAAQVEQPATLKLTDPSAELNSDANDVPHHTHQDLNGVNDHTNGISETDADTAPSQSFPDLPPFPSNVPTAPLLRISLSSLHSRDANEVSRFTRACEDLGFFYLDLQNIPLGEELLGQADKLFKVGEELFALPVEEKKKYDFSGEGSYFGYKGIGTNVDREGRLDRNEFYNVCSNLCVWL